MGDEVELDFVGGSFPRSSSPSFLNVATPVNGNGETPLSPPSLTPSNPPSFQGLTNQGFGFSDPGLDNPLPLPQGYELPQHFSLSGPPAPLSPSTIPYGVSVLPPVTKKMMGGSHNYLGLNCIDVANHITACPVCSKLHKSHSPIYIGIIVFLIIVIFFLGRKFFD